MSEEKPEEKRDRRGRMIVVSDADDLVIDELKHLTGIESLTELARLGLRELLAARRRLEVPKAASDR